MFSRAGPALSQNANTGLFYPFGVCLADAKPIQARLGNRRSLSRISHFTYLREVTLPFVPVVAVGVACRSILPSPEVVILKFDWLDYRFEISSQ